MPETKSKSPKLSPRGEKAVNKLLESATRLFYENGIHATGIDTILADSGVAKMTLYKHFGSKDALVAEYLKRRDEEWLPAFKDAVANAARSPKRRLYAIFNILGQWLDGDGHRGCALLNASVEFPDRSHDVRKLVANQKQELQEYLTQLSREAGARRPNDLAVQLAILIHGAIAWHSISGSTDSAPQAAKAAKAVIQSALPQK
jgi:AcrR family transcriptional regulator